MGHYVSDKWFGPGLNYLVRHEVYTTNQNNTTCLCTVNAYFYSNPTYSISCSGRSGTISGTWGNLNYTSPTLNSNGNTWIQMATFSESVAYSNGSATFTIGGNCNFSGVSLSGTDYGNIIVPTQTFTENTTEVIPNVWIWNGSSWVRAQHFKIWNGSNWVDCKSVGAWNGSSWAPTK
jgi:hypothetical protein